MNHWVNELRRIVRTAQSRRVAAQKKNSRRPRLEQLEVRRYLAGDLWTQRGGDAGHDNYVDTSIDVSQLNHDWTADNPTSEYSWYFDLAIDQQRVYRTEKTGTTGLFYDFRVVARDIETGTEIWSTPLSSFTIEGVSEPAYANGVVYVNAAGHSGISGGTDAMIPKLYGLDAATGAVILTQRYAAQWDSGERPVLSGDRLIVEDGYYGGISSYQASTLTRQWNVGHSTSHDPPYAAVDDAYAYAFDNEIYALADGTKGYINHPTPGVSVNRPTVSASGRIIYGMSSGGLSAFDGDSHQHLWSTTLPKVTEFAVGNGMIAVTGGSELRVLRESDGALVGTWAAPDAFSTTQLILTNSHVFVESVNRDVARIHAVNLNSLTEEWRFEHHVPDGYARMGMSLVDGRLAVTHEQFTKMFRVGAPNNAPTALDDAMTVAEDAASILNVLANDSDPDGHSLTIASTSLPQHGVVTINSNQTFTYTGATDYFGSDAFNYEVSDGRGGRSAATVYITVNPVNDPPVADDDRISTLEDTVLNGRVTAQDIEGNALTYRMIRQSLHGSVQLNESTGEFVYTPESNFAGEDEFLFAAYDGIEDSAPAVIVIDVEAVNDPPEAVPMLIYMDEDGTASGQLAATDIDSAILSFLADEPWPGGVLSVASDGRFTFQPPTDFHGQASFDFRVSDGYLTSLPARVDVIIKSVNDAPRVSDATFVIDENLSNGSLVGVVTASDIDSTSLSYALTGPDAAPFSINRLTGALTVLNSALLDYERQTDFVFQCTVSDDQGASATGLVRVRLRNVFDIAMDVLPTDPTNTIILSNKEIEVALLGSHEFNPASVDLASVRLMGPTSATGSGIVKLGKRGYKTRFADVNGDGVLDLVMSFSTSSTGLKAGDTLVRLTGVRAAADGLLPFDLTQAVKVRNRRR